MRIRGWTAADPVAESLLQTLGTASVLYLRGPVRKTTAVAVLQTQGAGLCNCSASQGVQPLPFRVVNRQSRTLLHPNGAKAPSGKW